MAKQKTTASLNPDEFRKQPELVQLSGQIEVWRKNASELPSIDSDVEFEFWAQQSLQGSRFAKAWRLYFDESRKLAHATWKRFVSDIENVAGPIEQRVGVIDRALGSYRTVREQRRLQQLREDQEAAQREQDSIYVEAAEIAASSGNTQEAERIIQEGAVAVASVTTASAPFVPDVEGLSFRENWRFEIMSPALIPREYLIPDETRIGAVVRALKKDCHIPGIRVYSEQGTAKRSNFKTSE